MPFFYFSVLLMFRSKIKKMTPDEYLQKLNDPTLSIIEGYALFDNLLNETDPIFLDTYKKVLEEPPNALNNKPTMNFRGEIIDQSLISIPNHLTVIGKEKPELVPKIKEILIFALMKYYTYTSMLKELLLASKELGIAEELANILQNQIWSDNPSTIYIKPILFDIIELVPDNVKQNYLYWYLFTPDSISHNFPTIFHSDIFTRLMELIGKESAVLLLYQAIYQQLQKPIYNWAEYPKEYLAPLIEALELINTSYTVFFKETNKSDRVKFLNEIVNLLAQSDNDQFLLEFNPSKEDFFNESFIEFWEGHINSRSKMRKSVLELLRFEGDNTSAQSLLTMEMVKSLTKSRVEQIIFALKNLIEKRSLDKWQPIYLDLLLEALEWQFNQVFQDSTFLDEITAILEQISKEINNYFISYPKLSQNDPFLNYLEILGITLKEVVNRYYYRRSLFHQYKERAHHPTTLQKREGNYQKYNDKPKEKRRVDFNAFLDLIQMQKSHVTKLMFSTDQENMVNFFSRLTEVISRIVEYPMYSITFIPRLRKRDFEQKTLELFNYSPLLEQTLIRFYQTFDQLVDFEQKLNRYDSICFHRIQGILDIINDFIAKPTFFDFDLQYINHEREITR